jgi:hypothetical protein
MPDDTRSDWTFQHWHAYQRPLGEVVCNGRSFFAWKAGCLIREISRLEKG